MMSPLLSPYRSAAATSRFLPERIEAVLLDVEHALGTEAINLQNLWEALSPERDLLVLSLLIKADLRGRFRRGEHPQVAPYLDQFASLKAARERVVSLVYEEYCLLRERGEVADPDEFCDRYEPWRDSLLAQLQCHELLSQAAGIRPGIDRLPSPGDYFRSFRLRELLGQGARPEFFWPTTSRSAIARWP